MVPYYNAMLLRNSLTAAACAAACTAFGVMDANPSLYCYHQWLQLTSRLSGMGPSSQYQRHFANKTVWIVGASSGIGEELAYQLSPYCGKLILSSRNADRLRQVADTCRQKHNQRYCCQIAILPMDVTSTPEELEHVILEQLMPEISTDATTNDNRLGNPNKLDCIIFNAGQGHLSTVQETSPATTIRMFQVNAIPPIVITQLLLQLGILTKKPQADYENGATTRQQVVLTSSVAGHMGVPLSSSYAASKHALQGYAASLQAECSSWLRVDTLCPGPIDTPFFQNQPADSTTTPSPPSKRKSPLKMSVERLTALVVSHMVRPSRSGEEAWIAKQPTLLGMYVQHYLPGLWRWALNRKVGPKRLSLYERGVDLYDPASRNTNNVESSETREEGNSPK